MDDEVVTFVERHVAFCKVRLCFAGDGRLDFGSGSGSDRSPVLTQPTNQVVLNGGTATFGVVAGGTGPFSYQWQLNGTNLPNGIITTVAGNGTDGYSGDGGAATNAELNRSLLAWRWTPPATCSLRMTYNKRIRKVGTNGIITTVAGNGTQGYSGDGGAATNAELNYPAGVAVDATGNLFIADSINNRIRKVGTNGIITTVAGNGTAGYSGDGGAATNAELNDPSGVAVDATGNLFIADDDNNRIRKVGTNGIITTVAGNGTSRLLRRRGRGDQCGIELSHWRGGGRHRQPVHCGFG